MFPWNQIEKNKASFVDETGKSEIYHSENSGSPESHPRPGWYFQPVDFEANEVYSDCYPTAEGAYQAALAWEEEQQFEQEAQADGETDDAGAAGEGERR